MTSHKRFVGLCAGLFFCASAYAQAPEPAPAPSPAKPIMAPIVKPVPAKPAEAQPAEAAKPAEEAAPALLDINSATKEELQALPGVGEARAAAIVKGRPYKGKDELYQKKILSKPVYQKIKDKIIARQA